VSGEPRPALALTAQPPDVRADVVEGFPLAAASAYAGVRHDWHETVISAPAHRAWPPAEPPGPGARARGRVQAARRLRVNRADANRVPPVSRTQREVRYYLLSQEMTARACGAAVRGPWGIAPPVRGVLAGTFHEEHSRIRAGHAAETVVVPRHLARTPLPREQSQPRLSRNGRRRTAGWTTDYLLTVRSAMWMRLP